MRSYLIAATPRVGGNWLCRELTDAGLGAPGEWLNWLVEDAAGEALSEPGLDTIRSLWDLHAVDGIYGVKIHLTPHVAALGLDDLLPPGPRAYIFLRREDRRAQARSWAVARAYDCWFTPRPSAAAATRAEVRAAWREIDEMDTRWRRWFAEHRIAPLQVSYEQLTSDLRGTVKRIDRLVRSAA